MIIAAAWIVVLTLISYPVGLVLGSKFILPVLNTLPAYIALVVFVREGRHGTALGLMLLWALTLALAGSTLFALWPADTLVLNGPAYRDEMLHWIRTGEGSEGDPRLFLPQHILHLSAFAALAFATASLLAMTLGAVLMNYMAFYVAALAREGLPLPYVFLLGWQPWAICRIVGFVALGVALARPLLDRLSPGARVASIGAGRSRLVLISCGCIFLDWILKATLAPAWGLLLRSHLP